MTTATLHTHGGNQTIRLPKDAQFHGLGDGVEEVEVARQGRSLLLTPKPPADSPQTGEGARAPDGKKPNIFDMMTYRPTPGGVDIADIDLDSLIPSRRAWVPRPIDIFDVLD